jgi:hypothetical protein
VDVPLFVPRMVRPLAKVYESVKKMPKALVWPAATRNDLADRTIHTGDPVSAEGDADRQAGNRRRRSGEPSIKDAFGQAA